MHAFAATWRQRRGGVFRGVRECSAGCGQHATNKCSRCKTTAYCGRECQAADWRRHKRECKALAAVAASGCSERVSALAGVVSHRSVCRMWTTEDGAVELVQPTGLAVAAFL